MKIYQCFKRVTAMKIGNIQGFMIFNADDDDEIIEVDPEFMRRHKPEIGGYLVKYNDGYLSYSPAEPFEEGYRVVEP